MSVVRVHGCAGCCARVASAWVRSSHGGLISGFSTFRRHTDDGQAIFWLATCEEAKRAEMERGDSQS